MTHLLKVSIAILTIALAAGSTGCRKKAKHPTPIPGYGRLDSTNYIYDAAPGGDLRSNGAIGSRKDAGTGSTLNPSGRNGGQALDLGSRNDAPNNLTTSTDPNATVAQGDLESLDGYNVDRTMFQGNTVFFEYDRASVKSTEKAKIAAIAEHLKSNPTHALLIEGNCDERGTEEYNRSLGERRALAVREYLLNLGISAERIRTISYGEDRPKVDGHDEAAWSKNRRAEFGLLTPPNR